MHSIQLTAFAGYCQEDIYEYLVLQDDTSFCVVLDRFDNETVYDARVIANEFFHAAFVGQQLWMVSKDFSYLVPGEYSTVDFEFEFGVTDLQALAATLYYLVRSLGNDADTTVLQQQYLGEMDLFGFKYSNSEIEPVCDGLLYIYEEAAGRAEGK